MKKILVFRFSAMGDVVLLVPVLRSLVATYADVEVTIVTRPKFASFFHGIERVVVFPADVDYTYNGVLGMRDLFRALIRKADYDLVIDLHDHIRTIVLRTLFKIFATRVIVFNKGRKEKKAFSRKENKNTTPLPHTVERYKDAFVKAGYDFELLDAPHFESTDVAKTTVSEWLSNKELTKNEKWIGIAPFAMHTSKIWPTENYSAVIENILKKTSAKFFLFGGGAKEVTYFENLQQKFPEQCVIVAGQLKLKEELALMPKLDLMICVDSSNMHLAALSGVPLLSIWGGTHPDVGFGPLSNKANIIQVSREELPCRPCSVYGRETCYVGGFPCMTRITAEMIAERSLMLLSK